MVTTKTRISVLDGFRALAIISVMLYHYFTRWTPPNHRISFYPYEGLYDYFSWGRLGVNFFFIISGFVIYFTLERTENMWSFWKKRMIRLLPSILIASIITFLVFIIFGEDNLFSESKELKNFIPSLLFIQPSIINNIFNTELSYLSGSYWSLWPEIQFYFFVSIIFYSRKNNFLNIYMIVSLVVILINHTFLNIQGANTFDINISDSMLSWYLKWMVNGFNLLTYLPFFSLGLAGYILFKNHNSNNPTPLILKIYIGVLIIYILYSGVRMPTRVAYLLMVGVIYLFIYYPSKLVLFETSVMTSVGKSSYFLYLIHEHIGVLLIYLSSSLLFSEYFVFPVFLIISFSYLSISFYNKIDEPLNRWLKKLIT